MAAQNLLVVLVPAMVAFVVWPLGMKYSALTYSLVCDACFAWAAFCFFRRAGGIRRVQRLMLWATAFTALVHGVAILYMNHARVYHFGAGVAIYTLSLWLFSTAVHAASTNRLELFFSSQPQPHALIQHGPYRWMRHPFYTSYTLAWVAGTVVSNQPILLLTILLNAVLYYQAASREERWLAGSNLAEQYRGYQRAVGMFLPRLSVNPPIPSASVLPARHHLGASADSHKTEPACAS